MLNKIFHGHAIEFLSLLEGAGTTPIVARKLNRNFYAGEPSAAYLRLAEKRMYDELGFFT
jgi:DNA modification methylase